MPEQKQEQGSCIYERTIRVEIMGGESPAKVMKMIDQDPVPKDARERLKNFLESMHPEISS